MSIHSTYIGLFGALGIYICTHYNRVTSNFRHNGSPVVLDSPHVAELSPEINAAKGDTLSLDL